MILRKKFIAMKGLHISYHLQFVFIDQSIRSVHSVFSLSCCLYYKAFLKKKYFDVKFTAENEVKSIMLS